MDMNDLLVNGAFMFHFFLKEFSKYILFVILKQKKRILDEKVTDVPWTDLVSQELFIGWSPL